MGRIEKKEKGMNIKELRQQQADETWRTTVFEAKKKVCAVCGSREHLEIHHVQAIANGGNNGLDNLLIVCQKHHKYLHGKIPQNTTNSGRKPICTFENAKPALKRYFNLEIGKAECLMLMGYAPKNHSVMPFMIKEYKKQFEVPKWFYNNIDLKNAQSKRIKTQV